MNKIVLMTEDETIKNKVAELAKTLGVEVEVNPTVSLPGASNVVAFPAQEKVSVSLAELEKQTITKALEQCKGNMSEAAKNLGIGRATLYRKVKEYAIPTKTVKVA